MPGRGSHRSKHADEYLVQRGQELTGRVRNVIRIAPHRPTGQVAWVKGRLQNVQWESRLERDAIYIAAVNPFISAIQEQPFVVRYRLDGQLHEYTPDLWLLCRRKPLVVEVKEAAEASLPENQARFAEIARVLAIYEVDFTVWTETEIRREPLLRNARYVLRFRSYPFEQDDSCSVTKLLEARGPLTHSVIQAALYSGISAGMLFAMVCHGFVYFDCNASRSSDPVFYPLPSSVP